MKMMTKEIAARLPRLYSQEKNPNPTVHVKFFSPVGSWTWYATEGQEEEIEDEKGNTVKTWLFFGYVVGLDNELGYFNLHELESVSLPMGLKIERDLWFKPTPLNDIKAKHER
jgi:hypothetical protein